MESDDMAVGMKLRVKKRLRAVHSHLCSADVLPPPSRWVADDWAQMEANRRPIFDDAKLRRLIDRRTFLRDGFVLLEGVMTDHARHNWTVALQQAQMLRD